MRKLTASPCFKSYLAALAVLSLGFLGALAMVSPECSHCTLAIADKAMLGARYLLGGWLFAGMLYCWDARVTLLNKLNAARSFIRGWTSTAGDAQI